MYCTGDLGYWNGNGELVCLGRADRQIKLQGFRLNLNDLETRVCRALPEVKAIAIARQGDYLTAMVEPILDIAELRSNMSHILPAYAMPRHIVAVESFPKTNAGKLDYGAVAEMTAGPLDVFRLDFPTAVIIADIWRALLNLGSDVKLDLNSNFLALGGDSIKQLQLASMLKQHFGCAFPLHKLIRNMTTIEILAKAVENLSQAAVSPCVKPLGYETLSPIELEWYKKSRSTKHASAFNVNYGCEIGTNIDRVKLAQAWNVVLSRHRILSSRFVERGGETIREYGERPLRARRVLKLDIRHEINRPFSLGSEDPIRVLISRKRMLVVVHHIVSDLTTLRILIREVADTYNGATLTTSPRSYADVTTWSESVSSDILNFWFDYLGEKANSATCLRQEYSGRSHVARVPSTLYNDMVEFSMRRNITLHQLALAAVTIALQNDRDNIDVVLGAPFMNRTSAEDLDTVGLFLEPLPIRIQYPSKKSPPQPGGGISSPSLSPSPLSSSPLPSNSFLQAVSQSSQAALAHSISWNRLLAHLSIPETFPSHPLFDTMVTFLEQGQMPTKPPLPGLHPLYLWTEGAKFKLMVEFMAVSDKTLLLRCEYDTNHFAESDIKHFERCVAQALRGLVDEREFEQVRQMVRKLESEDDIIVDFEDTDTIFGRRMCSL